MKSLTHSTTMALNAMKEETLTTGGPKKISRSSKN